MSTRSRPIGRSARSVIAGLAVAGSGRMLVGGEGVTGRYPHRLSGGSPSPAVRPTVLRLDETPSALDARTLALSSPTALVVTDRVAA